MPPKPPVARVIKVRLSGVLPAGTSWAVLDYWRYSGVTPTNADMNGFAVDITSAYGAHLKQMFHTSMILGLVQTQDLTSPTSAFGENTAGIAGTGGAAIVPNSACILESKAGNLRYRGGHSRTYWPPFGLPGAQQDGNNWTGPETQAFATALSDYLNAILANSATRPFAPIQRSIVHYTGKAPGIVFPYVEDVQASNVETQIRSQRGRLTN